MVIKIIKAVVKKAIKKVAEFVCKAVGVLLHPTEHVTVQMIEVVGRELLYCGGTCIGYCISGLFRHEGLIDNETYTIDGRGIKWFERRARFFCIALAFCSLAFGSTLLNACRAVGA